jgi:hypothetical protein
MTHQTQFPGTYKDRLLQVTMNHVGQDELGIVYCNGAFHHFEEPGYHRRPNPWHTRLVKKIPLVLYSTRTAVTLQTANGFEINMTIGVNYFFDPRQASPDRQSSLAHIALQDHPETILNRRIRALVKVGLDEYVGRLRTDELMQNGAIVRLQEWLLAYVHDLLHPDGVLLTDPDGVVVETLHFPESIVLGHCDAYIIQQIAEAISSCPPEVQELIMSNVLARRAGAPVHRYGGPANPPTNPTGTASITTAHAISNPKPKSPGLANGRSTSPPPAGPALRQPQQPKRPPARQRPDGWLNQYPKS